VLSGRTAQNKLLHFRSERPLRAGTLATARVLDAGPHFLRGELVEVLAAPRHRIRIPLAVG
jgi:hypothetical protein